MAYNTEYPYVDADRYNSDWLLNRVKEIQCKLQHETAERENMDKYLLERIETEVKERGEADAAIRNELLGKIEAEKERAETVEKSLHDNIGNISQTIGALDKENRAEHEKLKKQIDGVEADLAQEVKDRKTADKDLQDRIDGAVQDLNKRLDDVSQELSEEITAADQKIEQEIADREEADTDFNNRLSGEEAAREAEDKKLEESIAAEAKAREDADTALTQALDAEEKRAQDAETILGQRIDDEVRAREEADVAAGKRITEEVERAKNREDEIEGKITNETTRAEEQEQALNRLITEEKDRAQKEESSLSDRIDTLSQEQSGNYDELKQQIEQEAQDRQSADTDLEGQFADDLAQSEEDMRAYVDEKIAGLEPGGTSEGTIDKEGTEARWLVLEQPHVPKLAPLEDFVDTTDLVGQDMPNTKIVLVFNFKSGAYCNGDVTKLSLGFTLEDGLVYCSANDQDYIELHDSSDSDSASNTMILTDQRSDYGKIAVLGKEAAGNYGIYTGGVCAHYIFPLDPNSLIADEMVKVNSEGKIATLESITLGNTVVDSIELYMNVGTKNIILGGTTTEEGFEFRWGLLGAKDPTDTIGLSNAFQNDRLINITPFICGIESGEAIGFNDMPQYPRIVHLFLFGDYFKKE